MQVTQRFAQLLIKNVGRVIVGKEDAVELMMIALLCRGHVLIEDVPGVGKTTLASALARSLDCSFKRIQFTPDITPSDITGFSIVNFKTGELEYRPGLVMSQIVLADEINRTSPKTQSSLLEVMEEGQVTVDGTTYRMPSPFIVLATQNPWTSWAPIPCRRRSWTASSCACPSATPRRRRRSTSSSATPPGRGPWRNSSPSAPRRTS